jgi:hypothetical protein
MYFSRSLVVGTAMLAIAFAALGSFQGQSAGVQIVADEEASHIMGGCQSFIATFGACYTYVSCPTLCYIKNDGMQKSNWVACGTSVCGLTQYPGEYCGG